MDVRTLSWTLSLLPDSYFLQYARTILFHGENFGLLYIYSIRIFIPKQANLRYGKGIAWLECAQNEIK